ncbi:MAG: alpha-L-fucosidase [Clostridiales bacterium]|nr:alpha-L-fucosidase [Clostridiales bacterium]
MADDSLQWFREARFGMFIHWGLYAAAAGEWDGEDVPAIGEWIMYYRRIPLARYRSLMDQFTGRAFDARAIAALAAAAGMKYLAITAKHHEGFALFDSAVTGYKATAAAFGRDAIRELADACRERGLTFCLYYSQAQDWAERDAYGNTWDFPASPENFQRYLDNKVKPQLRELLTGYGPIGAIWFDTPMAMAEAESRELAAFVKSIQPDCLISGRVGNGVGDYRSTGDNMIPTLPISGPWEVPATLNDTWGFRRRDQNWKSPADVIRRLVEINGKGGNYLLNIGPDGDGAVPEGSAAVLRRVGQWMAVNGESIYGTEATPVFPYLFDFGGVTAKPARDGQPAKLYLHIFHWGRGYDDVEGELLIYGLKNRVTRAYALADRGTGIAVTQFPPTRSRALNSIRVRLPDPSTPLDEIDSVICLELEGALAVDAIESDTPI